MTGSVMIQKLLSYATNLAGDIVDRGAYKRVGVLWWRDAVTAVPAALAIWLTFARSAAEALALIGIPATLARIATLFLALVASAVVVEMKDRETVAGFGNATDKQRRVYTFGQPIRHLSKAILILAALLLPRATLDAFDALAPLPNRFYGYLLDGRSGKPIEDASVRVLSAAGVDLTVGVWFADSSGYYRVETGPRPGRDALLAVSVPGCAVVVNLPLHKQYEIRPSTSDAPTPIFKHLVRCEGEKR